MGNKHTIENFQFVPGRIEAAMSYVRHCLWLTDPITFCEFSNKGRPLTPSEQSAYQAALDALRLYFAGEMDFGGAPMRLPEKPDKEKKPCKCCGGCPEKEEGKGEE